MPPALNEAAKANTMKTWDTAVERDIGVYEFVVTSPLYENDVRFAGQPVALTSLSSLVYVQRKSSKIVRDETCIIIERCVSIDIIEYFSRPLILARQ